ncbi:MAG: S1 RNA-binding domain-containing protein [Ruminococcus sp.]|nr:S1 RNA-binding domain-containing protein [Ruminococcus sp.]
MQVEIGKIYEGAVKSITKYGCFVDISNPDNEKIMGMVHISEISRSFVNEIRDFVTEGQTVRVKVIGINEAGKISLSMKQTEPEQPREPRQFQQRRERTDRGEQRERPNVWEPKKKAPAGEMTFEDMLSRFKQNSEERMCDIKRNTERKNRSRRK